MDEGTDKPRLVEIAEILQRHGVEFLVIGGQAAALHGSPHPTFDVDLCYRRTQSNLANLANALAELHPTLRGRRRTCRFGSTLKVSLLDPTSRLIQRSVRWVSWDG